MGFRNNYRRYRYNVYLNIVQVLMPNLRCSFDVSSLRTPVNEKIGWNDIKNITYNFTLICGTYDSFGSIYPFCINVYAISYFPVLPIKYPINIDGELTTPFNVVTGIKPSVSFICVLFCTCFVRKASSHVVTKALNMSHQGQNVFRSIFVEFHSIKKGILCMDQAKGR